MPNKTTLPTRRTTDMTLTVRRAAALVSLAAALSGCARQQRAGITRELLVSPPARPSAEITSLRGMKGLVCSDCHNALTVETSGDTAIAFSHSKHLDRGYHCTGCHPSLAHGGMISPGHPQCFACHNGSTASKNCDLCHLRRADVNPHPPNFVKVHGKRARDRPTSCRVCHYEPFCTNCHTLEIPHPRNWTANHGPQIAAGDCLRCHSREYCSQCHRTTRPASHSQKDWLRAHGKASLPMGSNCGLCHARQFCLNCHGLPMPHPSDWTSAHAPPGRAQVGICERCHAIEECRNCHAEREILGHPPAGAGFLAKHAEAARRPSPDCRICHSPDFCGQCHPDGVDAAVFPGAGVTPHPADSRTLN